MGCNCKSDENNDITLSGSSVSISFKEKFVKILTRKNKFSLFGLIIFLILIPIAICVLMPIVVFILFNKLVLGKNLDITKILNFKNNKVK